jgi:hypothetical protein
MSKLDELMVKEMTRRQFLVTVGLGIVSLFGLSTIMGFLSNNESSSEPRSAGYGAQTYGR